jgi:hypothetical protein
VTQTSPNPQTLPEWNPVEGIQSFYFKDTGMVIIRIDSLSIRCKGDPKMAKGSTELLHIFGNRSHGDRGG